MWSVIERDSEIAPDALPGEGHNRDYEQEPIYQNTSLNDRL